MLYHDPSRSSFLFVFVFVLVSREVIFYSSSRSFPRFRVFNYYDSRHIVCSIYNMLLTYIIHYRGEKVNARAQIRGRCIRSRPALSSRVHSVSRSFIAVQISASSRFSLVIVAAQASSSRLPIWCRVMPSRAGDAPRSVANQITVSRFSVATGGCAIAPAIFAAARGASLRCVALLLLYI